MKKIIYFLSLVTFLSLGLHSFAMDNVQRLAIIKALKIKGLVGENNKGFLEFRTSDRTAEAVVNEENGERRKAYAEVAQKTGAAPEKVGTQRAVQIANGEPPGVWIQSENGSWSKK